MNMQNFYVALNLVAYAQSNPGKNLSVDALTPDILARLPIRNFQLLLWSGWLNHCLKDFIFSGRSLYSSHPGSTFMALVMASIVQVLGPCHVGPAGGNYATKGVHLEFAGGKIIPKS